MRALLFFDQASRYRYRDALFTAGITCTLVGGAFITTAAYLDFKNDVSAILLASLGGVFLLSGLVMIYCSPRQSANNDDAYHTLSPDPSV
ncbi:MAG: hypothetical protein K0Q57_555 [Gammaproteobacteria bacterium]|jgi:hypothetical protein|nr:hypothetical protein [Gammaproteobacteria bacterium]